MLQLILWHVIPWFLPLIPPIVPHISFTCICYTFVHRPLLFLFMYSFGIMVFWKYARNLLFCMHNKKPSKTEYWIVFYDHPFIISFWKTKIMTCYPSAIRIEWSRHYIPEMFLKTSVFRKTIKWIMGNVGIKKAVSRGNAFQKWLEKSHCSIRDIYILQIQGYIRNWKYYWYRFSNHYKHSIRSIGVESVH